MLVTTTPTSGTATTEIKLVLVSLADGRTDGLPVGCYLASYDAEANDGNGTATWTADLEEAMTFTTVEKAAACYRTVPCNRPFRPDGQPNRPLTIFSIMFD